MLRILRVIIVFAAILLFAHLASSLVWSNDQKLDKEKYMDSYVGASAKYTSSAECVSCHNEQIPKTQRNHVVIFDKNKKNANYGYGCEACHGPGGEHNGEIEGILLPSKMPEKKITELCSKCHLKLGSFDIRWWEDSSHGFVDLSCLACHNGHSENKKFLAKSDEKELCFKCHLREKTEFSMRSHHPVRENHITCDSCHNPHSGEFESQLRADIDDLCVTCHGDKQGPFIYDHDMSFSAGGEGCLTCHFSHGGNADSLLRYPQRLCLRCHTDMHREQHFEGSCWRAGCHTDIHGSNTNPLFLSSI